MIAAIYALLIAAVAWPLIAGSSSAAVVQQEPPAAAPAVSRETPDCSAMARHTFLGVPDPLECARQWAGSGSWQCVELIQRLYASYYTDPGFRGAAGSIQPNAAGPAPGRVVLTSEGALGHAALVYSVRGGVLTLVEANLHGDGRIEYGRELSATSTLIRGYYALQR